MLRALQLVLLAALAPAPAAQKSLLLRFDEGCGDRTVRYSTSFDRFQTRGAGVTDIITNGSRDPWVPGRFGTALRGRDELPVSRHYVRVDDTWSGGDLTVALWLRQRTLAASNSVLAQRAFGIDLRSAAEGGVLWFQFGAQTLQLDQDVREIATSWTHVALVHDATAATATFYLNGNPEPPIALAAPLTSVGFSPKQVGDPFNCYHDIDDYLEEERAYSAAEIRTLTQDAVAATGQIPSGCVSLIAERDGGRPVRGNPNFAIEVRRSGFLSNGIVLGVLVGTDTCSFGGLPLPFSLSALGPSLASCSLVIDQIAAIPGTIDPMTPTLRIPVTIYQQSSTAPFYVQPFGVDTVTNQPMTGNAMAIAIGS